MNSTPLPTRPAIVATAGHVDHGKSSIVKALTGTDPDRLPEEKARGITIELGFAHAVIEDSIARWEVGFVDVPGHEDFVKNMVAGVSTIQAALLVVAADDGWMPQTEEHLQILEYLGATDGVVALSKADLLGEGTAGAIASLRETLTGTFLEKAEIIPVSAPQGRGLGDLRGALAMALGRSKPPRDLGKPRLPIDRAFLVRGAGLVVTGTLQGGEIRRGQSLISQPLGTRFKVRSVQSAHRDIDCARPGMRAALQINAVEGPSKSATSGPDAARGHVLTWEDSGASSNLLEVELSRSVRLENGPPGARRPLKSGALVRMHLGTRSFPGRIVLGGKGPLLPGGNRLARIRLRERAHAVWGDRFVIRDWSERHTLGGGIVLDAAPGIRGFSTEARQGSLRQMREALGHAEASLRALLHSRVLKSRSALVATLPFTPDEITQSIAKAVADGWAVPISAGLIDAEPWRQLLSRAGEQVRSHHQTRPDSPGLSVAELQSALAPNLPDPSVFEDLVQAMTRLDYVRTGSHLRHQSHRPALPMALEAAGLRIRKLLGERPFDPPSRKELAPDPASLQALKYLVHTSEAVELGPDVILLQTAWQSAKTRIVEHLRANASATTSELRQLLASSRRVVIPLLERLDKEGVTRRQADVRCLGPKST
ncbi:MAG: selenocysteine-specific translation elongation factor [Verrucomicrobia bacterium]|nr:selenocysteine-specific translation elongation factor [Verrucomicrobiota bacterium]